MKHDFFSLLPDELTTRLGGSGRAKQVWNLVRQGKDPSSHVSLSARLRIQLQQDFQLHPARVSSKTSAACGTTKMLVEFGDAAAVETVIIPNPQRTTVCISTQVGCARACSFCATGKMGLVRQLSPAEIVFQINLAQQELASMSLPPVKNVVLMGMGEPLDNFNAVQKALAILIDPHGWQLAPRRITLSTIGPSPQAIRKMHSLPTELAWSLHAADDALRRRLIPKVRYTNQELLAAFVQVLEQRRCALLVEMILIKDINDSQTNCDELMAFFADLRTRVKINLLPVNPAASVWHTSPEERVWAFRKRLQDNGFFCEMRRPRGQSIQAACGQLAWSAAKDVRK